MNEIRIIEAVNIIRNAYIDREKSGSYAEWNEENRELAAVLNQARNYKDNDQE